MASRATEKNRSLETPTGDADENVNTTPAEGTENVKESSAVTLANQAIENAKQRNANASIKAIEELQDQEVTAPTGVGGATPKSRPDHQYQYPPNPLPDDQATLDKQAENRKQLTSEQLRQDAGVTTEPVEASDEDSAKT